MEKIQLVVILVPALLIQLVLIYSGNIPLLVLTGVSLVVAIVIVLYLHFKHMRNWQRFIRRE